MPTLSSEQIRDVLLSGGWPDVRVLTAVQIALAESGGRTEATHVNSNGTVDYGLLQINSVHGYDAGRLVMDPVYNARAGWEIFQKQGFDAWSTYKSGAFRQFEDAIKPLQGDTVSKTDLVLGSLTGGLIGDSPQDIGLDPLSTISRLFVQIASFIGKTAAWVANPRNWLRVAEVIVGTMLLGVGANMITKDQRATLAAKTVAKGIGKVA